MSQDQETITLTTREVVEALAGSLTSMATTVNSLATVAQALLDSLPAEDSQSSQEARLVAGVAALQAGAEQFARTLEGTGAPKSNDDAAALLNHVFRDNPSTRRP